MKNETLLHVIGNIDDNLICDAIDDAPARKRGGWLKWGALAACLALAIYAGARFLPGNASVAPAQEQPTLAAPAETPTPPDPDAPESPEPAGETPQTGQDAPSAALPMLTLPENGAGSMGFEGYMAYDSSELVSGNPWRESAGLSTLPVFQNTLCYDGYGIVSGADFAAMEAFLREVASRFGLDAARLTVTDDTPSAEEQAIITEKFAGDVPQGYFNPTKVIAEAAGLTIEVDAAMTATVRFAPAITLPDGLRFTRTASYDEILAAAEYLKEAYKDVLAMDAPEISIQGGDYNIYNQQMYSIEFYDATGDLTEQILNYHFNRAVFYCNDDGQLSMLRLYRPDLSDRLGDYPIITAAEATGLLCNGNYITSCPYAMPGQDCIVKTELVYRTGAREPYYIPYYRFYVELPEETRQEDGLKTYGAYYVPAVDAAYLTNLPVYTGSFS